jgi:uncharacterized protein YybS (DUF2232 family)
VKNVRSLTEGAVLLAAYTVILLITVYIPVIGIVSNLFLPVPVILYAAKNDWKSSSVFMVAAILISFIVGASFALPFTLTYGLTGAVMGALIFKKKSSFTILLISSLIFLATIITSYGVSVYFFKFDIIQEIIKLFQKSINMAVEMIRNSGQPEKAKQLKSQFTLALKTFKFILPTILVISSLFSVFITQLISYPIIKRFGVKMENWKPFRELMLPRNLLWYFLLTLSANMLFHPALGTIWSTILLNFTVTLLFFMVFQGYSFILYYFFQKGVAKSLSILLIIVSFVIPFSLYIVGILGIMDLGFDLRKRFDKKE